MEEIGLFPLGIVLLPTERVPLHIFEPRYKELIGECLDEGREFGLVFADESGLREVATRAAIVDVLERFPDGRLNIVVEGRDRCRVVALTSGRSFQTGEVEPVVDEAEEPDPEQAERALGLLRRRAELAGADPENLGVETSTPSFELAAHVELEPALKQELLELRSERARLRRLVPVLEQAERAVALQQRIERVAQTNGRVHRVEP